MRNAISTSGVTNTSETAHAGLWLQRMATLPTHPNEGLTPEEKNRLLKTVASILTPDVYGQAFARWRAAVSSTCFTCEVEATSRLIVGHGEPTPLEIGLALHPTYGVPYIPGSALKGVLSHYIHAYRGAVADAWRGPAYQSDAGTVVELGEGSPVAVPGEWYRTVFGSPAIQSIPDSAWRGYVGFEDALLVPNPQQTQTLERDCVTPHQRGYYNSFGDKPPVDWDSPNPVGLLSIRPGTRFLIAISFEREAEAWAEHVLHDLIDALERVGIGARTTAGYGRLRKTAPPSPPIIPMPAAPAQPAHVLPPPAERVDPASLDALGAQVARVEGATGNTLDTFDAIDFVALLEATSTADRRHARELIQPLLRNRKLQKKRPDELEAMRSLLSPPDDG